MRSLSIRLPEHLLTDLEQLADRIGADRAALVRTLLAEATADLMAEIANAEAPCLNGHANGVGNRISAAFAPCGGMEA